MNGGRCGVERWSIKTGTDSQAGSVDLSNVQTTTIEALTSLPAPNPIPSTRVAPAETTAWVIKNVTLTVVKSETDSDYHMVISDGSRTMIVEPPYPNCVASSSPFYCNITHARAAADGVTASNQTVTVVGVGMFDFAHGQTGYALNGIELHPLLAFCIGQDCKPDGLN
jgi:hypothetical protein